MTQQLGSCPLCADTALLDYTPVTVEQTTGLDTRLTDVACRNECCKNYISSERVKATRGNDPRQTWKRK